MTYYTNKSFNNFRLNFKEIIDLICQGISLNQISKEYEINRKSLGNYMKDEKLINSLKSKLSENELNDKETNKETNTASKETGGFNLIENMIAKKQQSKNNGKSNKNDWEVIEQIEKEMKESL